MATEQRDGESGCRDVLPELERGAGKLGLSLSPAQRDQFVEYCRFLLETNRHTNLSAIRTPEGVMRTLFLDSLTVVLALRGRLDPQEELTVVDVGAGAGFPGLPLRLLFPSWHLTLIESVGKKARFLESLVARLAIDRVEVRYGRAEELGRGALRDHTDLCLARAVSSLPSLIELCAPLTRPAGYLVFPKSGEVEREIDEARYAAAQVACRLDATVPVPADLGLGEGRTLVVYEKTGHTPQAFPRRTGLAQSDPLRAKRDAISPRAAPAPRTRGG